MTLVAGCLLLNTVSADEAAIKTLQSTTGTTGAGDARAAAQQIVAEGSDSLLPLLDGFADATPLGANWLRSVFETVAAAELKSERELPAETFIAFVRDTSNDPDARRLAYEWLLKQDAELEAELIPDLLQDPNAAFRRDAVQMLIEQAEDAESEKATELYRQAMRGAVHDDQVKKIAAALKEAGEPVDLQQHFGFLPTWKIIGPFDNKEMKGFAVAYPPESEIAPDATYDGQLGEVSWQDISTDDDYGSVSIRDQIENYKGSLMYATASFTSTSDREVQLRLGTPNAWKLWVNGELVFEREEYHRGTQMDQYIVPVSFRNGSNVIMLKVCQNEQEESWAQDYKFQLRVSDASGAAILSAEKG